MEAGEADLRAEPASTGAQRNPVQGWLSSGLERSDIKIKPEKNDNPGCFSGVAIKHRKFRSKVHPPKLMPQPKLLCRDDRHGRRLRHNGSAHIFRIQADHLSRLG